MSITLYGIPNCDTVKKARKWLEANGIAYSFHDYKKQGIGPARITAWIAKVGLTKVVNKAGTTYRQLNEAQKAALGQTGAAEVLAENNSAIKRPIVEYPGGLLVGFKEDEWEGALKR